MVLEGATNTRSDAGLDDLPAGLTLFPATRFMPPPTRPEHVSRGRCLARLAGPPVPHHVLICGPAGSGKSTLAGQWAGAVGSTTVWASLEPEDDEPGQFFGAVIMAVRRTFADFGARSMLTLRSGAPTHSALVRMCDEFLDLGDPVAVVLDDVHAIQNDECHHGLAFLLANVPEHVRFVLCTRRMPSFPTERLELHGDLAVIRAEDLRFDDQECATFLNDRLQLALSAADVSSLAQRVDGWAAGLYLASLSLRGGMAVGEFTTCIAGGDRRISDYLVAEAIEHADPDALAFLERAAVLGRFDAQLCDTVMGRTDSAQRIVELEHSNLFVIPVDAVATEFRLHHLFADLLTRRLAERDPDEIIRLHGEAGFWRRDRGEIPEAIEHLLAAGRYGDAADLIAVVHGIYVNVTRRGEIVDRWLAAFPAAFLAGSVPLLVVAAWAATLQGDRTRREELLAQALALPWEGRLPDDSASPAAQAALMRASYPFGDVGAALREVREAARLDDEQSPWWPLVQQLHGAWSWFGEGPSVEALRLLERGGASADGTPMTVTQVLAPALAAVLALELGDRARGERLVESSARLHQAEPSLSGSSGHAWAFRARAYRLLGRTDDALREAQAGLAHVANLPEEADGNFAIVACQVELARARMEHGEHEAARGLIRAARARVDRSTDPGRFRLWVEETEAAFSSRAPARSVIDSGGLSPREVAVLARLAEPLALREIADALCISHNTMKSHLKSIYRKLDVDSRDGAVAAARDRGLVS